MRSDDQLKRSYEDMLDMPHHVSEKHTHMATKDRAAQFASFAALKGYDRAVDETRDIHIEEVNHIETAEEDELGSIE